MLRAGSSSGGRHYEESGWVRACGEEIAGSLLHAILLAENYALAAPAAQTSRGLHRFCPYSPPRRPLATCVIAEVQSPNAQQHLITLRRARRKPEGPGAVGAPWYFWSGIGALFEHAQHLQSAEANQTARKHRNGTATPRNSSPGPRMCSFCRFVNGLHHLLLLLGAADASCRTCKCSAATEQAHCCCQTGFLLLHAVRKAAAGPLSVQCPADGDVAATQACANAWVRQLQAAEDISYLLHFTTGVSSTGVGPKTEQCQPTADEDQSCVDNW